MGNLEIQDISFAKHSKYPNVKNISLTVESGEIIYLVGPSGSGKTTLLGLMPGLLQPDSGRIIMDKHDITNIPIYDRRIGFVAQNSSLFPHLNIIDNIIGLIAIF